MSRLGRHSTVVLAVCACALIGTLVGAVTSPRRYTSEATLDVPTAASTSGDIQQGDLDYTDRLLNTYKRIAGSDQLRNEVTRQLRTSESLTVELAPEPNTELVRLIVRASDRDLAERGAQTAAQVLIDTIRKRADRSSSSARDRIASQLARLQTTLLSLQSSESRATGDTRARLAEQLGLQRLRYQALASQSAAIDVASDIRGSVFVNEAAQPATGGLLSGLKTKMALGLVLGGLIGLAAALLLERRFPRMYSLEELEQTIGGPVLVSIPASEGRLSSVLSNNVPMSSSVGLLRTQLLTNHATSATGPIVLVGLADGEDTSGLSRWLATSIAHTKRRVLLINADLVRPGPRSDGRANNGEGLSRVLRDDDDANSAVHPTKTDGLFELPSGQRLDEGEDLLASETFRRILESAQQSFDYVIVNSPDVSARSGATSVAAVAGAVVLVVPRLPLTRARAVAARALFDGAGARVTGMVVDNRRAPRRRR